MSINDLNFQSGEVTESLDPTILDDYLQEISEWRVSGISVAMLQRDYKCKNFVQAMDVAQEIGQLSERHNHHPELTVSYGNLKVCWWTHTASGITSNDVYMANQCDGIYQPGQ